MELLRCEGVGLRYGGRWALRGVSLAVRPGDLLAVVGPNGAGKTTLLRLLGGLMRPSEGRVLLGGRAEPWRLPRREVARRLALVGQDPLPPLPLSVREVAMMGRYARLGPLGAPGPADRGVVRRALEALDCWPLRDRSLAELSGGERRRVQIAQSLAQEPEVLLLDEPSAHLDLRHVLLLLELLRQLAGRGRAVVLSTHDLGLAARLPAVLVLHEGRAVALGPPAEAVTPELVRRVYGVEACLDRDPAGFPRVTPLRRFLSREGGVPFEEASGRP